jgi:glutamyl/glutaminyl-tRNA synthetase
MESKETGEVQKDAPASEGTTEAQVTTPSLDEVMAKLKAVEATNARLLKESQEHKAKAKTLLTEKETKEKEELESQGKVKEAYQMVQKKLLEKDQELMRARKVNINKTIDAELAKLAGDAHSVDDVKKFLPVDVLEIVEENDDIKISGLKEALDLTRKEKPYLFKQTGTAKTLTAKPGVDKTKPLNLKDVTDMRALASMLTRKN